MPFRLLELGLMAKTITLAELSTGAEHRLTGAGAPLGGQITHCHAADTETVSWRTAPWWQDYRTATHVLRREVRV